VPNPSPSDVEYFAKQTPAVEVTAALLGRRVEDRNAAARALAELASDPVRLHDVLAGVPGGALAALSVLASSERPMAEAEIARRAEVELGPGRGADAFRALLGRGFLGMTSGYPPRFAIWDPLAAPIREALAGADLTAAPDEGTTGPDRGALAIALLLGHLSRRRPKLTVDGDLYKRDAEEADRIFGAALGRGVAELFVVAFRHLGLLAIETAGDGARNGARLVPEGDAAAFFALPRAGRVRAFAEAHILPRWLECAFRAGRAVVSRDAIRRAARAGDPWADGESSRADAWIGYCVAAGILEELPGGLRASPEIRGERAAERPGAGHWLVQPNLEVVVPPEVPPGDAFRLACTAEIASLDRAAVLRLTPASLAQAADAGLDGGEVLARLESRAAAPIPDLVGRAVREGVRGRSSAHAYEGVVVVVPEEARARVRDRAEKLVRSEIAPGVFLLEEGAQTKFAKALAALEVGLRSYPTSRHVSTDRGYRSFAAKELGALLALRPAEPADPRVAGALSRARNGEPGEFVRTERPVVNPPAQAAPAAAHPADVDDLLEELLERIEAGEKLSLEGIALAARGVFSSQLERVLEGRVTPERLGSGFVRSLERVLGRGRAADRPAGEPGRPAVAAPVIAIDWERVAAEAIAAKQDLWLKIVDEGRPRSVTPHEIARRGEAADLLALAHDSGDLRVFPGHRIQGAAPAGASEPERLPGSGPARAVLRTARNDRCPCGSGRKYKACCLPADLAAGGGG